MYDEEQAMGFGLRVVIESIQTRSIEGYNIAYPSPGSHLLNVEIPTSSASPSLLVVVTSFSLIVLHDRITIVVLTYTLLLLKHPQLYVLSAS